MRKGIFTVYKACKAQIGWGGSCLGFRYVISQFKNLVDDVIEFRDH
jgi:hypothetical protein